MSFTPMLFAHLNISEANRKHKRIDDTPGQFSLQHTPPANGRFRA